jgi:hypothetical protein
MRVEEESLKASPMSWEQWIAIEGFKRCIHPTTCILIEEHITQYTVSLPSYA